jgi:hypothetical protein
MTERAMLMELVDAAEALEPDWRDVLRRAGFRARNLPRAEPRGRRRTAARVLVFAALAAAAFALSAVAADQPHRVVYWLFDRSHETYPRTQVPTLGRWHEEKRAGLQLHQTDHGLQPDVVTVSVLDGEVAGHRFEIQAFLTRIFHPEWPPELFVGFNPGGTPPPYHGTDIPAVAGGGVGFPVLGIPGATGRELHWAGWSFLVPGPIESGGGTGPKYLFGPAAANVQRVELRGADGSVVSVPTFPGPSSLGVPVRLWVAVLRLDQLVQTIVPRDEDGKELERWHLPTAE